MHERTMALRMYHAPDTRCICMPHLSSSGTHLSLLALRHRSFHLVHTTTQRTMYTHQLTYITRE